MAVTSQQVRTPGAAGGVTNYSVPWMFHYEDALLVMWRDIATATETVKLLGTDYTVTGAHAPAGGEVIFNVATPSSVTVHIIHDPDLLQRVVLVSGAAIPVVAIERQLDDMVHQNQRTRDLIGRALFLLTDTSGTGEGEGEWDARGNRIINVADPINGQDAATKAYVASQTILGDTVPGPGSLTNTMWNASSPLALQNVQGMTIAQQQAELNPLALADSATLLVQLQKLQYQLLNLLNWTDAGGRGHAYEAMPASNLPAVIAAAVGGAAAGTNVLLNGSLLVSQREPSESATGSIVSGAGNERFPLDRWAVRCDAGTITWARTTAAGKRNSTSRSYIGLELIGGVGVTSIFLATRLTRRQCQALRMGTGTAKNFTFGFKVKNTGTLGSVTPTLRVKSTSQPNDAISTKFATAFKATVPSGSNTFAALVTPNVSEAAYTFVVDLGTPANAANGVEFELEFITMNAVTTKVTVSDLWVAVSDISSTLLVDDFYEHLEKCKRHYQKTFDYDTKPVNIGGLEAALVASATTAGEAAFQWDHVPPLMRAGISTQLTLYSAAGASPANDGQASNGAQFDTPDATAPRIKRTNLIFQPSGASAQDWYIHAAVDAEWYDS